MSRCTDRYQRDVQIYFFSLLSIGGVKLIMGIAIFLVG